MKVCCVGNMNNMLFSLTRFLRDRGVDAELLLLNNELPHFKPSADTFDLGYQDFVRQLSWGDGASFVTVAPSRVTEDLAPYDFVIVSGPVPAFMDRCGLAADVYFPYGGDFYHLPFLADSMPWYRRLRSRKAIEMYDAQARGIQRARVINQEDHHVLFREALLRLGVADHTFYFGVPMVYTGIYDAEALDRLRDRSAWYLEFKAIRDRCDLLVFHHNRLVWKNVPDAAGSPSKRNDAVIRGFADCLRRRPQSRCTLVVFEYGPDLQDTRDLVAELDIAEHVRWFPLVDRKEVMTGLNLADFGCGQFGEGCIGGGTTWEVLAVGKPLLHYINVEKVNFARFGKPYPVVNVHEPDEIADVFERFLDDPEPFRELGCQGARWYRERFCEPSLATWTALIDAKARGDDPRSFMGRHMPRRE